MSPSKNLLKDTLDTARRKTAECVVKLKQTARPQCVYCVHEARDTVTHRHTNTYTGVTRHATERTCTSTESYQTHQTPYPVCARYTDYTIPLTTTCNCHAALADVCL